MLRGINKRAQTPGMNQGLLLVLGLAGVALVIFGIYTYYNTVIAPANVDVDLTLMEQVCSASLGSGESFYCSGKYEVKTDRYIGCVYAVSELGLKIDFLEKSPTEKEPVCGEGDSDLINKQINEQICNKIKLERGAVAYKPERVYVNNEKCSDIYKVEAPIIDAAAVLAAEEAAAVVAAEEAAVAEQARLDALSQ